MSTPDKIGSNEPTKPHVIQTSQPKKSGKQSDQIKGLEIRIINPNTEVKPTWETRNIEHTNVKNAAATPTDLKTSAVFDQNHNRIVFG